MADNDDVPFNRNFPLKPGVSEQVVPGVRRVLSNNPSPFTFTGTVSYIIGQGKVAIVDPGPDSEEHAAALLDAVRNETVTHILVTHTHRDHRPDIEVRDGDLIEGSGWALQAVATPGHTANHLAFAWPDRKISFVGDHVMGWSTSIVAPPDGSMVDYMASLDRLAAREED